MLWRRLRMISINCSLNRVHKLYKNLGLKLRGRQRKKIPAREKMSIILSPRINECWSLDFMGSATRTGIKYRTFNALDDYNREALTINIERSISSLQVIRILENLIVWRGIPKYIRNENGPDFTSRIFEEWVASYQIKHIFIQPGKPTQNSLIERFNGTYRREV